MNLLHIDSSPQGDASISRRLSAEIVAALRQKNAGLSVVYRDVAAQAPDHLTAELLQVVKFGAAEGLTARQKQELDLTVALTDEFLAADVVVIGAPMYNFSIPSQLKAWVDRIAQPGKTFRYTAEGPQGLAGGKKVIIASSRGGMYAGMSHETAMDHQEAYLRAVLGFFGITDVTVYRVEGAAMGPDAQAKAWDLVQAEIAKTAA